MQDDLSTEEREELHKLTKGLLVRASVDSDVMERLAQRGFVRGVLGGWKMTPKGLLALRER